MPRPKLRRIPTHRVWIKQEKPVKEILKEHPER